MSDVDDHEDAQDRDPDDKLLRDDEWVMKATIPEAANSTAIVRVLPTADSIPVDFNDLGQLYTDSWPEPGVILPVIPYGKLYQLVFNSRNVDDFYFVSLGYGGGVADVSLLECFAYEHKYSRPKFYSGSECDVLQIATEENDTLEVGDSAP